MILDKDFKIDIGFNHDGPFVRATHKPTGFEKLAESVAADSIGAMRDALVAELRRMIYDPDDIRVDYMRTNGGEAIRVVHVPSGLERTAIRSGGSQETDLLDEILEELYAGRK
ncbi:hypothetical protein Mal52_35290 [Symmachiella dynata]|uniref:Uncharacterized protein n=1 Tax=Symmachiella dynata TaxID=2527995 RepID=A0A517ZRD0_9PLAN|nr:hypothetical protein [Symmachiella dynata]QDU45041.1 hypothetical protein Mal52_35290 [Symmachiella dynata]